MLLQSLRATNPTDLLPIIRGVPAFCCEQDALTFLGVPVNLMSYTSSVLPIICAVFAQSKLEALLKKVLPSMIRNLLTPLASLAIIVPATFLIIGPVTNTVGNTLAAAYTALVS